VCAGLLGLTLLAAALAPMAFGVQFAPAAALVALAFIYPLWSWRRLNAAAHFLGLEMQDLQKGLPMMQPAPQTGGDFLARRISAVEHASRELRRLHHFVSESLLQLPSATFVCDDQGRVLLANTLAQQYAAGVGQRAVTGLALPTLLQGLRDRDSGATLLTPDSLRSAEAPLHLEGEDRQGRSLMLLRKPLATGTASGWIITLVDLSAMRQALAQRDQAMHFISHDIRAPIGAIITLLDMREANAGPASAELLQRIERYAQSSLTLADDFVHLARAQNQPLRQEAVDLAWVLEQAIDDCWAQAQAQDMELSFLPPEEAAMLQGDASLLRRAIVNLIGNAIKYGRPAQPAAGGARIECTLAARGSCWTLAVRDHGPGIPADQQGRLFQAFDRLQNQNNTQTKGVGLGLAFVHTVVTRHGGQIEVSSSEGTGSVFTLVLPKLPEDSATTM
ncbi:MAG: HAMP domain-containing sensor histidine kinase, partial [Comamonas sp.]